MYFLLCTFYFSGACEAAEFQKVRLARGDVDGDGKVEVIAGGRIGNAVAVDVPRGQRRAGVGVYRAQGQLLKPIGVRKDLQVIHDVAAGDLDGDGMDEVVTVGMGRLSVFGWRQDELSEIGRAALVGRWTDRVAVGDVDSDGLAEIAVTVYQVDSEAEIGYTQVVIYKWQNGLTRDLDWVMRQHVGDLEALDRGWVMEVGSGEEGGELQGVNRLGWPVWQISVSGSPRALSLDRFDGRLAVGRIDGVVQIYGLETGQPKRMGQQRVPFLSGLLFVPNGAATPMLMMGARGAGIVWMGF